MNKKEMMKIVSDANASVTKIIHNLAVAQAVYADEVAGGALVVENIDNIIFELSNVIELMNDVFVEPITPESLSDLDRSKDDSRFYFQTEKER